MSDVTAYVTANQMSAAAAAMTSARVIYRECSIIGQHSEPSAVR